MISHQHFGPLALALATLGCTINKSEDSDTGTTTGDTDPGNSTSSADPGSTGATAEPTTAGPTTADPTVTTTVTTGADTTAGETGTGEGNDPCIETPTVLALGDASPGGFSGEQLLVDKLGVRMTKLLFASEPTSLAEQWKGKELPLTVDLRHEGGEVRWIDSEVNPDWDDSGNESGFPGDCVDRLEVDVEIDFVTEGKEFDEHREGVLTATEVGTAELQVRLMPPGLMGSLDLTTIYTPTDPETLITGVWIFGFWGGTEAGGSVMHEVAIGDDDDGIIGFGPLAAWGDAFDL